MKKIIKLFLILVLIFPFYVKAEDDLAPNARSAILIETSTGSILYEKNINERVSVASLTKMMSQILILEAKEEGKLSWDEKIKVSANAAGYGGTQIYLEPGEVMTARDLMKGVSVSSANDATVALAERIAGSEEKFVEMMNKKAKELKLENTNFVNATGLDEDNNYSTAYDLAVIAKELLKHEEILEFSKIYEDYLRQDTNNKFWLVNTNKLVRLYEGADGLKTGFTDNAKYCMAVTAKRNNLRLLAIVLGEEVSKVRNKETTELLDYGFNSFKANLVKSKDEIVTEININKGSKDKIKLYLKDDIIILSKKDELDKKYEEKIILNNIKLPIKENTKLGLFELYDDKNKIGEYDLISKDSVKKKSYLKLYLENIKKIIKGDLI